jgi:hypothetical protein
MKRRLRFRPRASQLETYAKRHMWKRMALVGISDSDIMARLVAACRALSLVIVPEWPAKSEQPSERIKQRAREERLRKLCAAYDRVELLDTTALPDGMFDAVVLLGMGDDLDHVGGIYAGLVRDGGWLMGDDTRDAHTRAILAAVAPGWVRLDDGLWCVRVRRAEGGEVSLPPDDDGEPAHTAQDALTDDINSPPLADEHDPIHSGPDVDEVHEAAPDVAGAEGLSDPANAIEGAEEDLDSLLVGPVDNAARERLDIHGVSDPLPAHHSVDSPVGEAPDTPSPPLAPEIAGADVHEPTIAPKRRGGRPKGSRNKAKVAA